MTAVWESKASESQPFATSGGSIGLVAGATDLASLRRVRALAPSAWILCPGVGAQGGDAAVSGNVIDASGVGCPWFGSLACNVMQQANYSNEIFTALPLPFHYFYSLISSYCCCIVCDCVYYSRSVRQACGWTGVGF